MPQERSEGESEAAWPRGAVRERGSWDAAPGRGPWPLGAAAERAGSSGGERAAENKTKRQRLLCALGASLGRRRDAGVAVVTTTSISK